MRPRPVVRLRLNTSAATALATNSSRTMNVRVANGQSRSTTYSTVETTTRDTGVASSTTMPTFSRTVAAGSTPASDSSSPAVRHTELTTTPPRSTTPMTRSSRAVCAERACAAHRPPRRNIIAETMNRTAAIRIFSHLAEAAAPNFIPPHEPSCTPRHAAAAERRLELTVTVVDRRAGRRGDADHERAGRRRRAQRNAAPGVEHRHFDDAAADPEQRRHVAGDETTPPIASGSRLTR